MPDPLDEWHAHLGGFTPRPRFDEYAARYREHVLMERRDGIIELRMHTDGGPVRFSWGMHNALPQVWHDVGQDPENEVVILTSTGDAWMGGFDPRSQIPFSEWGPEALEELHDDARKLVQSLVFSIDVPIIAAVNGGGFHAELALFSDITLCAEHATFTDPHFAAGHVPGDGLSLSLQGLLGPKRAAYAMYTSDSIDAQQALALGLVNEVLPAEDLLPRAWEIAGRMMKAPRATRRHTHALVQRPWKRLLVDDLDYGMSQQSLATELRRSSDPRRG